MPKTVLPPEVVHALADAQRTPGWNNRANTIRRFDLNGCALYVVPFRCWAYRKRERLADEYHRDQHADMQALR